MSKITLNLQYRPQKNFELIYNSLLDFKKFGALHPSMKNVEVVANNHDHTTYFINEEVALFGFLKIKPQYQASVFEIEKNRCIQYTSQVKKNIYLRILFTFCENAESGVTVKERIELQCNRLVGAVFLDILKKAHNQVFLNLAALPG